MRFSRAKPTGSFRVFQRSTRAVAAHSEDLQDAEKSATYWTRAVSSPMEIQERFPSGEWVTIKTVKPKFPKGAGPKVGGTRAHALSTKTPRFTPKKALVRTSTSKRSKPRAHATKKTWTLDERTQMSRAFDRGNYANAYESTNLEDFDLDEMTPHERAAFVLGFFGSYALSEIGSDERDAFDEAYWSPAGQYVVHDARYTDSRDDDYREESGE